MARDGSTDSERLRRVEIRLTRLAAELGINVLEDRAWLTLDEPSKTIYISRPSQALSVINAEALRQGAKVGEEYEIVHGGDMIGTIIPWEEKNERTKHRRR